MTLSTRKLAECDVTWSEDGKPVGFQVGRAAALLDWSFRREQNDPQFKRLIWRLQAKKYWQNKKPENKARIRAYRRQWYQNNKAHHQAMARVWKRRKRAADPAWCAREAAEKRQRRAKASLLRRAATVYRCHWCGAQWCMAPRVRIPTRPPKWCSLSCRGRAAYAKKKGRNEVCASAPRSG